MHNQQQKSRRQSKMPPIKPIAAAVLMATATQAGAFQLDTGSDWNVRWDNTVKFNYMVRAEDQKDNIVGPSGKASNIVLIDDASLGWDKWDTVSSRFDLLSELDVIWKDNLGFRISGAGWYDFAYDDNNHPGSNPNLGGLNTWGFLSERPGDFTDEARKYHEQGGELLDAFVFANFDIGNAPSNVRLGRHTIYWGNSLLFTGAIHGVAGSMVPIDAAKAYSVPGSEAQELFLPTNKVSTVVQLTPNLTLNAYYSLEYQEHRLPQEGTYFSPAEFLTDDASEFIMIAPGYGFPGDPGFSPRIGQNKISDEKPDDTNGEWGFNVQYYFNDWDFEGQFMYLNYASKIQDGLAGTLDFGPTVATLGGAGVAPFDAFYPTFASAPEDLGDGALGIGQFNWTYKENVDLFAIALSKEIAGMSTGLEYVYRMDAPLRPDLGKSIQRIASIPDPLKPVLGGLGIEDFDIHAVDTDRNYPGPVGDTQHLILNTVGLLNGTSLWDGGSYIVEFVASWISDVSKNEELLRTTSSKSDISSAISVAFVPEYYQVFAGTDMKIPMSVSYTLDTGGKDPDEPAIGLGGNPGVGNASIGLDFNIRQTWNVTARYNAFFGSADNGIGGGLTDRDNLSLTVKRTF